MRNPVEAVIDFQNAKAEVFLPKGATNIKVVHRERNFYLSAIADSSQTEMERYILSSYEEKQEFTEEDRMTFMRKVNILGAGVFYWYYQKA